MQRDNATFTPETSSAGSMGLAQLEGRHARLQRELANAFCMQPWPGALIDRLALELALNEAAIAVARSADPLAN